MTKYIKIVFSINKAVDKHTYWQSAQWKNY